MRTNKLLQFYGYQSAGQSCYFDADYRGTDESPFNITERHRESPADGWEEVNDAEAGIIRAVKR